MTPSSPGYDPPPRSAWCACHSPPRTDCTSGIGLTPPGHALRVTSRIATKSKHAALEDAFAGMLLPEKARPGHRVQPLAGWFFVPTNGPLPDLAGCKPAVRQTKCLRYEAREFVGSNVRPRRRWVHQWCGISLLLLLWCAGCGRSASPMAKAPEEAAMFQPKEMADAIHAVVAADHQAYVSQVLGRLPEQPDAGSTENWRHGKNPPSPAHLLRLASEEVQKQGAEFHYILRSLTPLSPKNSPETTTERAGLEFVLVNPGSNYYAKESLGGRLYLTAVYPDIALSSGCCDCHNRPAGQRATRTVKPGDVLGGLVVRVPLEF
jgi:hypothetical protein